MARHSALPETLLARLWLRLRTGYWHRLDWRCR